MTGEELDFHERWAATRVRFTSPNGQLHVTLQGDERIEVRLAPGYWERATAAQITAQVGRVARLTFVARTKAFFDLRSDEAGERVRPARRTPNARAAEYDDEMARLAVEGRSDDGSVTLTSVGLTQFAVVLAPGARDRLDGASFGRALSQAATALLRDQLERGAELREWVYRDRSAAAPSRSRPSAETPVSEAPAAWRRMGWQPAAS